MKRVPFPFNQIRGAIGKEFVIKRCGKTVIETKYPDMTRIKPSEGQLRQRRLFKEAVDYAMEVMEELNIKTGGRKRLGKRSSVFNASIKEYLLRARSAMQISTA